MSPRLFLPLLSIFACFTAASCSSTATLAKTASKPAGKSVQGEKPAKLKRGSQEIVRTTAYTHLEKDSLPYGKKNAAGTQLKYGKVRSAAADWSVYPLGTVFKIEGQPYLYEVDDYGSALVGTETIDLYKPSFGKMNDWGVRHVPIKVVKWGDYDKSLHLLSGRTHAKHCREMYYSIKNKKEKGARG